MYYLTKKHGIQTYEISVNQFKEMYNGNKWLSTRIIDSYLEHLVLQDIKRFPVKHCMKYVPTFFTTFQSNDPENMFYSRKMHRLFTNQKMEDYHGIIFGGTDPSLHFFTVVLFLEKKEVFIFDPLEFGTTLPIIAKFLHLLFQHSNWLDSGVEKYKLCEDYTFTEVEKERWTVCHVKPVTNSCPLEVMGITVGWI